jgi:GNAT superfamily N-acetyltransferase
MYQLRFYQPADFDFWLQLHHEAYRPRVEPIWGWDAAIQRGYAEKEILTPYSGQFIVQQNGQPVGYLSYTWEASGELYLSNIILIPAMRGRGLGGQIVRDLQAWAKRLGRTMYLRTFENNPAKQLYESLGFVVYEHNTENHHYYLRWHP